MQVCSWWGLDFITVSRLCQTIAITAQHSFFNKFGIHLPLKVSLLLTFISSFFITKIHFFIVVTCLLVFASLSRLVILGVSLFSLALYIVWSAGLPPNLIFFSDRLHIVFRQLYKLFLWLERRAWVISLSSSSEETYERLVSRSIVVPRAS